MMKSLLRSVPGLAPFRDASMRLRADWEAKRAFSNSSMPPILVYQMGKVGSLTVHESLKKARIGNPVLHVHYLSGDLPKHKEAHKRAGVPSLYYHMFLGDAIRRVLDERQSVPCRIITLVRDPIAFVVSDLFQNPYFAREHVRTEDGEIVPERARDYLERSLSKPDEFHKLQYVNSWFDRELKQVFGIDVFSAEFPIDLGYAEYSKGDISVLVIRLEDLSRQGPAAISGFLGMDKPLELAERNVRVGTSEGALYDEVLRTLRLEPDVCRMIYSSRLAQHFYSEGMIDSFVAKWSKQNS